MLPSCCKKVVVPKSMHCNTLIINVNISNNTFKNNKVKLVSLLWGAKNNTASNNTVINSGEIKTEQNLKLTLMY